MAYDFINTTISGITGLTTIGQAITSGSGVAQPSATYTGITGTIGFPNNLSGSFTSSLNAAGAVSTKIYVVNGLIVSASV
jgi:hypothetical protein